MIRSQLIAGLSNSSHQSKVLKTLDQLTTRILTLEATERASSEFTYAKTSLVCTYPRLHSND